NKEIEEGEREQSQRMAKAPPAVQKSAKAAPREAKRDERTIKKEMTNLERTIARLDEQKKQINAQLLESTDPAEALRLHHEVTALADQLTEAEEKWCALQLELEG